MSITNITKRSKLYWNQRAVTYTDVNKEELNTVQKDLWKDYLYDVIIKSFNNISANELNILDIGTGPAFIAIILAIKKFKLTAIDFSNEMLHEAKKNIKAMNLDSNILLRQMDAHTLDFPNESFDIIISRNLTWNLENPIKAYTEWFRVLKKNGLLMIFDANWYAYLYDDKLKLAYEKDRENVKIQGLTDQCIGKNFDECENIAKDIAQSHLNRPSWDINILENIGFNNCTFNTEIWRKLWDEEKKINFASTPLFEIMARKN